MPSQTIPPEAEFTLLKKDLRQDRFRTGKRYRCALATLGQLLFPDSGEHRQAWVFNLSEKGIGLNLQQPPRAGHLAKVRFMTRRSRCLPV